MQLRRQARQSQVSRQVSLQAPTAGLNARDPLAAMKETEAVVMDNYFPTPSSVDSRRGSLLHASGFSGVAETIMVYGFGIAKQMFAVASGNIYDVTSFGPVGAADVTGLSNSRFQYINFGTAGSQYILAVNGQDKMQIYDGTTWSEDGDSTTVTGFDTADAISIINFKNRVWFIQDNSMLAWYLPVSSIGGAANNLDFAGTFRLGGYLMAMANWTIDNASGVDDYAAFISSEGEVALYKGTDPSSAATWALVGTFRMGRPIGRRCFCKTGADVLIITTDGAFPLSKALLTDRSQLNLAATDNISNLINQDVQLYYNNFGWQPILYPTGNKLIINVPNVENVKARQYVMNTQHGAWCRFLNWNASCFEVMGENLFYGTKDAVIQADVGFQDIDGEIQGAVQQAFSYFRAGGLQKMFKMARPILISEGTVVPAITINVDFNTQSRPVSTSTSQAAGAQWDIAPWNTSMWAQGDVITRRWQSIAGVGISGSLRIETSLKGLGSRWVSTDVVYEVGTSL